MINPMIKAHRIIFSGKLQACLEHHSFEDNAEHENEIVIETAFSAVSSGSELVAFTNDRDMGVMPYRINTGEPYPAFPEYAAVGTIVNLGDSVKDFDLGDMVFVAKGHASHHRVDVTKMLVIRVPEDVLPQDAVYVRFCAVSMATLRTTVARPGDGVAIFGLGVVGTMAAQIYQVSGYLEIPAPSQRLGIGTSRISNSLQTRQHCPEPPARIESVCAGTNPSCSFAAPVRRGNSLPELIEREGNLS